MFDQAWQRQQFEAGWAGIDWPKEYGGLGLDLMQQLIWYEEFAQASAPGVGVFFVGLRHAGPTLMARGDEAQKTRHLPAILRGDEVWCQGFSEPEAGSDLASLRTRARISEDGEALIVNGRKIWTSYAHVADVQELLVRTNAEVPKHRGITWVICEMDSPGITTRPIETIHGQMHFCEVTYDDVRLPLSNVVGGLHQGWSVAMSTLSFERGTAFMAEQVELAHRVEELVQAATELPSPDGRRRAIQDDEIARRLGMARIEVAALRSMTYASVSRIAKSGKPGPEGSMLRLYYSLVWQRTFGLALEILGEDVSSADRSDVRGRWTWAYLNSFRATIAAGTKDIQRNIIGERVLGLPR
jgi:alkylation response protein AidB-like acyl-CoA dehydrogenase